MKQKVISSKIIKNYKSLTRLTKLEEETNHSIRALTTCPASNKRVIGEQQKNTLYSYI